MTEDGLGSEGKDEGLYVKCDKPEGEEYAVRGHQTTRNTIQNDIDSRYNIYRIL